MLGSAASLGTSSVELKKDLAGSDHVDAMLRPTARSMTWVLASFPVLALVIGFFATDAAYEARGIAVPVVVLLFILGIAGLFLQLLLLWRWKRPDPDTRRKFLQRLIWLGPVGLIACIVELQDARAPGGRD
jgi:hypothetical protein